MDVERVREARREEVEEVRKHQVYVKVPIGECWERKGKGPIDTRWLDINKGDKILEIGTGSGYQTAVLFHLGAKVYSIERQHVLYNKSEHQPPRRTIHWT